MKTMTKKLILGTGLGLGSLWAYNRIKKAQRAFVYRGRVVLISGGSRGLGLVLARQLARRRALISLLARDEAELQKAKAMIEKELPLAHVIYQVCDVKDPLQVNVAVKATVQAFGRLDVVINNAGVISTMPYENSGAAEFDDAMETHFWGAHNVIQAALPYLKHFGGGRILNVSSIGGKVAVPHLAPYCASKFALLGYSKTLRAELTRYNIYVTTISPGLMRTGSIGHAQVKGQVEKEFSWFAWSSSLPFLTVNAEQAAREILEAGREGRAELVISWPAKAAVTFQNFFPELFADLSSLANRLLPRPTQIGSASAGHGRSALREGRDAHSWRTPAFATALSAAAAQKNNEGSI
jgi:NAD(P)-dependent dehydrogenase (short-subunit alcohol dehydrogenase family)